MSGQKTEPCPDIYASILERTSGLLFNCGRSGMIVPLNLCFSRGFEIIRKLLFTEYNKNWFSSFGRIPSALFSFDVRVRNTIHIGLKSPIQPATAYTTRLHRWYVEARSTLFPNLTFSQFDPKIFGWTVPRLNSQRLSDGLSKHIVNTKANLSSFFSSAKKNGNILYYKKTAYNWLCFCKALPPCFDKDGNEIPQTKFGELNFRDDTLLKLSYLFLNGKIMFAWWSIVGDDFDLTRWMFANFPLNLAQIPHSYRRKFSILDEQLDKSILQNLSLKKNAGKTIGNYNLAYCRHITDQSDLLFLKLLGMDSLWDEIELLYLQIVKTGFKDKDVI